MFTPWGPTQQTQPWAIGIVQVFTASHGGFHLDDSRNAAVHETWRNDNGWYEEDCEWAIVALTFPDVFDATTVVAAHETAKSWYPDSYEAIYAVTLTGADSYVRRQQEATRAHSDDWVVICAYGDWHHAVPAGMVGCIAAKGAERSSDLKQFLVPDGEYDRSATPIGFPIDPARHQPWAGDVYATKER
jgi:hypothetical protein